MTRSTLRRWLALALVVGALIDAFSPRQQLRRRSGGLLAKSRQVEGLAAARHDATYKAVKAAGSLRVTSQFVSHLDDVALSEKETRNGLSIVLVDIGVRDVADLTGVVETVVPNWTKFLLKLENSGQVLSTDKFLYSHDVGDGFIRRVSLARIPSEMYQKLQLARSLMENVSTEMHKIVSVTMVDDMGQVFVDADMCDALQSACEMAFYPMPTLKVPAIAVGQSQRARESAQPDKPAELFFLAQDSLFTKPLLDDGGDDASVLLPNEKGSQDGSAELENVWHYFQDTSAGTASVRKEKISALEAAMLASSSSRRDLFVTDSDYSTSSSSSSSPSALRGLQDFKSLEELKAFLSHRSAVNEGTNIARALSALPPNILNPESYVSVLETLSGEKGWVMDQWSVDELQKLGCGAFSAVCQGSLHGKDRLVRLRVSPRPMTTPGSGSSSPAFPQTGTTLGQVLGGGRSGGGGNLQSSEANDLKRAVVLVGKGVTYDTGGINLKSANSMKTMKHDMAGSSVALGVFNALTQMDFPFPVECWLAIVENNNGPSAYRPDDVVTAVTGETIEVVHSDAEGRMLLADVLALASRKVRIPAIHGIADVLSPKVVIDFATLTGTTISSLSSRYIGGFSNRKELLPRLIRAGETSGERVWSFPCDDDFADDLKSDVADVLQCRQPTEADHIYATAFLKRFVAKSVPWIHLDLGSAHRPGGHAHVGSDYTGSGVRATVDLLTDNFL